MDNVVIVVYAHILGVHVAGVGYRELVTYTLILVWRVATYVLYAVSGHTELFTLQRTSA